LGKCLGKKVTPLTFRVEPLHLVPLPPPVVPLPVEPDPVCPVVPLPVEPDPVCAAPATPPRADAAPLPAWRVYHRAIDKYYSCKIETDEEFKKECAKFVATADLTGPRGAAATAATLRRRFAKYMYDGLPHAEKMTYEMLVRADTPEKTRSLDGRFRAAYFLDKSSTTADPELQALEAVALADLQGPDGIRALVEEFSTHWKLRDFLASALSLDTSEPLALTTYYLEDWKDILKMVKS
jgi:hypothetical protein